MDIVEFAEKILDVKLYKYQKEFLKDFHNHKINYKRFRRKEQSLQTYAVINQLFIKYKEVLK